MPILEFLFAALVAVVLMVLSFAMSAAIVVVCPGCSLVFPIGL